jgi:hypothetical protein
MWVGEKNEVAGKEKNRLKAIEHKSFLKSYRLHILVLHFVPIENVDLLNIMHIVINNALSCKRPVHLMEFHQNEKKTFWGYQLYKGFFGLNPTWDVSQSCNIRKLKNKSLICKACYVSSCQRDSNICWWSC